jgi:hypothetical protein
MKKLFVIALAAVLVVMFSVPAMAAVTHKFGGYWRTRFFTYDNLGYTDDPTLSLQGVDTRTRLFYTAGIHDNLKLVTQTEFDAGWGSRGSAYSTSASYGARGADQVAVEIKRVYADIKYAGLQWQIGTQGFADATGGYIYNDDFTGMKINYRADNYVASLRWIRLHEGSQNTHEYSENGYDTDLLDFIFNFKTGNHRIAPFLTYMRTNDSGTDPTNDRRDRLGGATGEPMDIWFLGARWDGKFGNWSFYAQGAYETGEFIEAGKTSGDVSAYFFDGEARVKLNQWSLWGRFMYLTGDDDTTDNDIEGWFIPGGANHSISTYAEFWGTGRFDRYSGPIGATGRDVTDMMNFGLGAEYKMSKAWNFKLMWWNLNFAEDGPNSQQVNGLPRQAGGDGFAGTDTSIGNEIDLLSTWKIMNNLQFDFIFGYLILGDAIEDSLPAGTSSEDPWELGAQLSLKF